MKLVVHILGARNLPPMDGSGSCDSFAKLQLGKLRAKSKVAKKCLNPTWDQLFKFRVLDLADELSISIFHEDKLFPDDFIGQVKVPLTQVLDADNLSLGDLWLQLQPKSAKKPKLKDCGEIHVAISLSQNGSEEIPASTQVVSEEILTSNSDKSTELKKEHDMPSDTAESSSAAGSDKMELVADDKPVMPQIVGRLYQLFRKANGESSLLPVNGYDELVTESVSINSGSLENQINECSTSLSFDELLKAYASRNQEAEMPSNLSGGVVFDQYYAVAPSDLNAIIFSPTSSLVSSLAEIQGTTNLEIKPWALENGGNILKRVMTYTKAPTKLVKSVKAMEEQSYVRACEEAFAVLASVSTPDVPFGTLFKTEVLYCIIPGPEQLSEEKSSHLIISWQTNFLQRTFAKSMIENGTRQGMKDNFAQFSELLAQRVKSIDLKDAGASKDFSSQTEQESDWKLAIRFFGNLTVISCVFLILYFLAHIMLVNPNVSQGLEFPGLDLPDSFGEVLVCGIMFLQGQRVLSMIAHFLQARKLKGGDHGVKAQGNGWVLTVALIEGTNLPSVDSTGYSDPYVVFKCNGKEKTSSIKFQTLDPRWNEIFEFDAMVDPPSVMDIVVYDFDGPFDEVIPIGHAEVNFVKSNISDLADIWIPLQGKLAQACQAKVHVRIFLNNTKGGEVVKEYLNKMEKEVGKKITLRSPHTNSAFQKIFGLPPVEFLINDFTCHLKRKMLTQGRLFLSPRIIGFYSNLFGHKTRFFFLWEDIEDIQLVSPTFASMGSPSLLIVLRKGKGMDAKYAAKIEDNEGRLVFHFQSFASFTVAHRTILALWKARSLSPEEKVQIIEETSETKSLQSNDDTGAFLGIEDANMSEIYSCTIPVHVMLLMEMFSGGPLEQRVMEKVGCAGYSVTSWEPIKSDVFQRQIHYKLSKNTKSYQLEISSTQQKSPLADCNGWTVEEEVELRGFPLSDFFNVHLKFQIEDRSSEEKKSCEVRVHAGIAWRKSSKHQKKTSKSIMSNLVPRLKTMFSLVEKELTPAAI